jgi:hypothetical protein
MHLVQKPTMRQNNFLDAGRAQHKLLRNLIEHAGCGINFFDIPHLKTCDEKAKYRAAMDGS